MTTTQKTLDTIEKVGNGEYLNKKEILYLLSIDRLSHDAKFIMDYANAVNIATSKKQAEVHAQIGLNLSPCPKNCSFCAFAAENKVFNRKNELPIEKIVEMAKVAEEKKANALFIMSTADYPFGKFIEVSHEIKNNISNNITLIANIGDFNAEQALTLKDIGYKGIYHAIRMGEGTETTINPYSRHKTIQHAKENGLLIGTCVEPIGPEHSNEEIVEKILIGRDMKPCYSGAMRRINIPGSSLERYGMLTEEQLAYLVAVVRLSMGHKLMANCTHEPNEPSLTAGANLLWSEVGTNPRDTIEETSQGRGCDVYACQNMLKTADWNIVEGESVFYSSTNLL